VSEIGNICPTSHYGSLLPVASTPRAGADRLHLQAYPDREVWSVLSTKNDVGSWMGGLRGSRPRAGSPAAPPCHRCWGLQPGQAAKKCPHQAPAAAAIPRPSSPPCPHTGAICPVGGRLDQECGLGFAGRSHVAGHFVGDSGMSAPLLTPAAFCPRGAHPPRRQASRSGIPMTVAFGGCSPPHPMWERSRSWKCKGRGAGAWSTVHESRMVHTLHHVPRGTASDGK
jgi:hypothetical protein